MIYQNKWRPIKIKRENLNDQNKLNINFIFLRKFPTSKYSPRICHSNDSNPHRGGFLKSTSFAKRSRTSGFDRKKPK